MSNINRYVDLSPAAYSPMSMNEIFSVPQAMRMQHDRLDDYINTTSGIIKPDPLDVHKDEALNIKKQYDLKLQEQAERLAKEGFNSNSLRDVKSLNREVQQLMAPTGRIGQINAAKKVYYENLNNYLEDATKNKGWSRERALANWKQNMDKPYTGFDEAKNIVQIGQYGAPKKIETLEKLKAVKDLLGEQVVSEIGGSGYNLVPQADGSVILVDTNGKRIETSNAPNLKNALALLNQQMQDPEWRNSMIFEGTDPAAVSNEIAYGIASMLKNDVKDNRSINASLHGYENGNKDETDTPSAITEAVKTSDVNTPYTKALGDLISNMNNTPSPGTPTVTLEGLKSKLTPSQHQRFVDTYNSLVAQGKITKSKDGLIGASQLDKVYKDWQRLDKIQASNQVIIPSSKENDVLASPNLVGKDSNEKNSFIQKRIAIALNDKQKVLYDKEGKPVDLDDIDLKTVQLNGHYSPMNMLPKLGGNTNNTVSPHSITWMDKDGDAHTGYLLRDKTETNNRQYRGASIINKTFNRAVANEGRFVTFTSSDLPELRHTGLDKMRVKYDHKTQTYTVEALKNNKVIEKSPAYTSEEYQNVIYNLTR